MLWQEQVFGHNTRLFCGQDSCQTAAMEAGQRLQKLPDRERDHLPVFVGIRHHLGLKSAAWGWPQEITNLRVFGWKSFL